MVTVLVKVLTITVSIGINYKLSLGSHIRVIYKVWYIWLFSMAIK